MPDKITPERIAELRDAAKKLRGLVASLKDGERLDWLESGLLADGIIEGSRWDTKHRKPHFVYFTDCEVGKGERFDGDSLREAIDAAMKKEG